ncbi:MAG: DUF177 domain-containing protein [Muribaculum sp.]|nr:DUF177 domain-containing protein [Muribaculaceae bacterium]MCM1080375.1 DUF177 domain-containing protein [Muribaculum sp.]
MGKFSAFNLPLKSLPTGTHDFDFHLDKEFFKNMESSDVRDGNIDVHVTVVNKGHFYDLTFNVNGEITLLCDRCLDEMQWPIDTQYHIVVKYGPDFNDDSDELLEIPETDNYLNVAYMIYDTIVLAIPIKHVHPLGKCNRAMSTLLRKHRSPGSLVDSEDSELQEELLDDELLDEGDTSESATDPRWDALKNLTDNN